MTGRRGFYGPPVEVRLACGHVLRWRSPHMPVPGVLMWCGMCCDYTHRPFPMKRDWDDKPILGEWWWKCLTSKSCNGGQHGHGASQENARYAAWRHSRKHPQHEVWLIEPHGIVTERWGPDTWGAPEPLWKDPGGIAVWKERGSE